MYKKIFSDECVLCLSQNAYGVDRCSACKYWVDDFGVKDNYETRPSLRITLESAVIDILKERAK